MRRLCGLHQKHDIPITINTDLYYRLKTHHTPIQYNHDLDREDQCMVHGNLDWLTIAVYRVHFHQVAGVFLMFQSMPTCTLRFQSISICTFQFTGEFDAKMVAMFLFLLLIECTDVVFFMIVIQVISRNMIFDFLLLQCYQSK